MKADNKDPYSKSSNTCFDEQNSKQCQIVTFCFFSDVCSHSQSCYQFILYLSLSMRENLNCWQWTLTSSSHNNLLKLHLECCRKVQAFWGTQRRGENIIERRSPRCLFFLKTGGYLFLWLSSGDHIYRYYCTYILNLYLYSLDSETRSWQV